MKKKKSTFFADFKAFITRGNVMDLAIGVVIGGAFSAIVNSLVNDIIMPLLTLATGDGVQGLTVVLNKVPKYLADGTINPEAVLWNYGNFLQAIINFMIIALCIFLTIRIIKRIKSVKDKIVEKEKQLIEAKLKSGEITEEQAAEAVKAAEQPAIAAPAKETSEELLMQIRDLLKDMKPQDVQEAPNKQE
ncbi:MAG: large conductance mechanosensitive channel protein MscL [Clostridia bacterium]|nr:large conductance mechanosensitive channel protein MscL [Clostridia bacterium]